jgi:Cu/Zn superoxide dismutase
MRRSLLLLAATTLAIAGCGSADEPADSPAGATEAEDGSADPLVPVEVSTDLVDPEGSVVGTAWFRDDDGRAMVEVQVAGLTEGFHPMYLYEVGTCDLAGTAADDPAFLDLPALLVLEDGVGSMSTLAGPMSLDELLADDGTAIVITQGGDTVVDIPAAPGEQTAPLETGSHVACGAVDG